MTAGTVARDIGGREVALSNLDKVLFPEGEITKGELIDHYANSAAFFLAAARARPLTLRRYPDGITREGWFQKHAPDHLPAWIQRERLPRSEGGGTIEHIVADGAATLVYLANLAAIELHVGPAPARTPDRPDEFVLDLDPPPGAEVDVVRRATQRTRALLTELGIHSRVKTTGSAGFHVHVPLHGPISQALARDAARSVATILAHRHPDELTVEHRIKERHGRVFVDWLRNSPRQTFVAAYSVRAREHAPVATPIDWSELDRTIPTQWSIRTLPRRLDRDGDPWQRERHATNLHEVAPALSAALREVA